MEVHTLSLFESKVFVCIYLQFVAANTGSPQCGYHRLEALDKYDKHDMTPFLHIGDLASRF